MLEGWGQIVARRVRSKVAEYRGTEQAQVDARQLALDLLAALKTHEPAAMTLAAFVPRWIEEHARANRHKPRGIASKESILRMHLLPRFGDRPMNTLVDADIQGLKADLAERQPKTVNNVLSVLNKLLRTAVRWNVLPRMPVTIDLLPVLPPGFSFYDLEEWRTFIVHAEAHAATSGDYRRLAMILLGGDAGLRAGEMRALEWDDVDLKHGVVHVQRSESRGDVTAPKSGRSRVLPMTRKLASVLTLLESEHGDRARVLNADGKPDASEQNLRTWMVAAQRDARIKQTGGIHALRHTFCSHLAMRGAPMLAIKELAGHQSLRTTMRYMHLGSTEARRAIALLDRNTGPSATRETTRMSPAGFEPSGDGSQGIAVASVSTEAGHPVGVSRTEQTDSLSVLREALKGVGGDS